MKKGRNRMIPVCIWSIFAVLCIVYGCIIEAVHSGTKFYLIWIILGILCAFFAVAAWQHWFGALWGRMPVFLKKVAGVLMVAGIGSFLVTEGLIVSAFHATAPENLDVVVVLGAQIKPSGPSKTLKNRLNAAIRYLEENPGTRCIVSGGQGANEPVSEADGMAEYLYENGITPDRVTLEDQSLNTVQNIRNSMSYLDAEHERVGIVTSDFHLFRGMHIAKKQGIKNVSGIAAATPRLYKANNMCREFFGVGKDVLKGNM